jgi:Cof subfamily protein (haloacid dehalogenase superfamily)
MEADKSDAKASHPLYRMIAIDLDGTLLSPEGRVAERTKLAVHKALAAGLMVCFATGRNWTESQTVLDAVAHYDSAVFVGGAMVVDTKRRVTLHRTMMQPSLAAAICEFFENRGHAALALQDKSTAGVDYLVSDHLPLNAETELWMTVSRAAVKRLPNLGRHDHEHTIRISIVAVPEKSLELMADLRQQFGSRMMCHSLSLMALGVEVLEVFDPGVNKWQGILHVAAAHGIDPAQIIAIGDDVNDIPMISQAGLGVAMGNAKDEVKAIAGRVIGRNDQDGLALFLEELVNEHEVEPLTE